MEVVKYARLEMEETCSIDLNINKWTLITETEYLVSLIYIIARITLENTIDWQYGKLLNTDTI